MKLKGIFFIFFCGITFLAYGQKQIHLEQIAFEYYKDSILKNYQLKNKLTISAKIVKDVSYWNIDCLKEFNLRIDDTATAIVSAIETMDLNIGNDNRFQIKKFKKKNPPMIFATTFLSFDTDKYITGIIENYDGNTNTYLFEINKEGEIKKWCKGVPKMY